MRGGHGVEKIGSTSMAAHSALFDNVLVAHALVALANAGIDIVATQHRIRNVVVQFVVDKVVAATKALHGGLVEAGEGKAETKRAA
jgi:hypothetical protein